jgi:hypothetical protein
MRRIQRTRPSAWQSSIVASSTTGFSVSTNDPSLSVTTAPMATLELIFGGNADGLFVAGRPRPSVRPVEAAPELEAAEPTPTAQEAAAIAPEPDLPSTSIEEDAPAASTEAPAAEAAPPPAEPIQPEEKPHPHRIELIIDSLPNLTLTEPIPVSIDPLGDAVFTATVRSLAITATGHSIGEALLILKEQIEFVYNDLSKRSRWDSDEKIMLQLLHTYIAPPSRKPDWMY